MRFGLIAILICVGLILLVAFTGDADAIDPWNVQDNVAVSAGELAGANTIGQTFVSHYPRLHAIEVRWIVSPDLEFANDSRIILHLRRAVSSADLAVASIALGEIRNNDFAKFSFSPIEDSQDQRFYFLLDASRATITRGAVSLWASAEDDYPDGQMYVNGASTNRDLAFRVYYEPDMPMVLRALPRAAELYLPASLLALLLFAIPGLAFLLLFRTDAARHPVETIALTVGFGLAALSFASLLLLIFDAPVAWLGYGSAVALLILLGVAARDVSRDRRLGNLLEQNSNRALWCLAVLALLSIVVGFLQIRDTTVPLWKDSPVHAETIAGILSQGYLPTNFFYHFGAQSIVALLVQLSGAAISAAMLLLGPLLITQIGLSIFLLCKRLTGSDVAGLVGAACVWFLSPTPAYFTTWGRYPLLLGAALLPLALLVGIEFVEQPRFDARTFLLVLITFWGMAFAHVRLAVFYLVFAAIYLTYLIWHMRGIREPRRLQPRQPQHKADSGQSAEADFAPLLPRFQSPGELAKRVAVALVTGAPFGVLWLAAINTNAAQGVARVLPQNVPDYSLDLQTAISVSLTHHGIALIAVAAIAVITAIFRRSRAALIVLAWFGALAAISALPVVGEKYLPPAIVVLMAFVPVSVVIGDLASWLYTKTAANLGRAAVVWSATFFIVAALGARDIISVVNPATILFTGADQNAMAWIDRSTPANSRFLVNSDVWFGGSYSPSDGGWWIPFLTGRPIGYVDSPSVTESADPETLSRWIDSRQIDFVYLGRRTGVLRRSDFDCQKDRYALVYNQDGIAIFQVQTAAPTRLAPRAGCVGYLP